MTSDTVPRSRLIEFAQPVRREVAIDPLGVYRTVGCHLYGEGVYERETKTGVEIKASRMFLIEKDDLVINRIWAQRGSAGIVPGGLAGAVVTQDFPVWALDSNKSFSPYIGWYLKTPDFWEECRRHSHGTSGRERLSPRELPNVTFPLPPLDEQRRIVARIEELATPNEEARGLRVKAREETEALLDSALYEVFATAETEGWDYKLVKDLCKKPQYGYTESAQLERVGPKFLRITDIQNGMVNWNTVPYCVCGDVDKYRLQPGDILFARTGATTGKSFLVKERPEAVFASYLIRLQLKPGLEPEYLYRFFQSPQYWAQVYEEKKGSAQANMNARRLSNIAVPVAPSKGERNRIVAYLDGLQAQVDELTALQDATQAELEALLPSVLDRAFRGEL